MVLKVKCVNHEKLETNLKIEKICFFAKHVP